MSASRIVSGVSPTFDRIVKRYNYEHVSQRKRARSLDLYHENLPSRLPRRGRDLVRALPMVTTLVSREGIVHHAHGRAFAYSSVVENMLLLLDTPVTYHADPLGRGVFLRFADKLYFQRPQMEWAALDGTKLARSQAAAARLLSNRAELIRQHKMVEQLGQDGLAEAKKGHEAAVSRFKAWQAGETDLPPLYTPAPVPDPEEDGLLPTVQDADDRAGGTDAAPIADRTEGSQIVPPSPAYRPLTPWLNDDPAAFLRRAEGNTAPSADPADGPTAAPDDADRPNPEQ